uniref:Uncharacterized protein n=1 Tax=Rhipicephalus microplus TaxID=6941 RepID=A0A6G5AFT3_RHIMP
METSFCIQLLDCCHYSNAFTVVLINFSFFFFDSRESIVVRHNVVPASDFFYIHSSFLLQLLHQIIRRCLSQSTDRKVKKTDLALVRYCFCLSNLVLLAPFVEIL